MKQVITKNEIPRCKTMLHPVIYTNIVLYPSLHKQRTFQDVILPHVQYAKRLHIPRKYKKKRMRDKKLGKLIKEYSKIAKVVRIAKTKILKPLPTYTSRAYVPTPKSCRPRTTSIYPMQLDISILFGIQLHQVATNIGR